MHTQDKMHTQEKMMSLAPSGLRPFRLFVAVLAMIVPMMIVTMMTMRMTVRMPVLVHMSMVTVMEPLPGTWSARVLAEDERLDRDRHGV